MQIVDALHREANFTNAGGNIETERTQFITIVDDMVQLSNEQTIERDGSLSWHSI